MKPSLAAVVSSVRAIEVPAALVATVTAPLACLAYVASFGVDYPQNDEWHLVPALDKLYEGSLSWRDLTEFSNEAFNVLPRAVMLALARLTSYDVVTELYASWAFIGVASWLLFRSFLRTVGSMRAAIVAFTPMCWQLFAFRQYENLLWGWQIQVFIGIVLFVAAMTLIEATASRPLPSIVLAGLCAAGSTFCWSNGLVVWPIGLLTLIVRTRQRRLPRASLVLAIWCLMALILIATYVSTYERASHHPSLLVGLRNPVAVMKYFLVALGAPFAVVTESALAVGAVLSVLYAVFLIRWWRGDLPERLSVLAPALMLYTVLSAGLLAVGRVGWGFEQARAGRYTTVIALGVVGLWLSVWALPRADRTRRALQALLLTIVGAGLLVGTVTGIRGGLAERRDRLRKAYRLATYPLQAEGDLHDWVVPGGRRDLAAALERHGLSVFRHRHPAVASLREGPRLDSYAIEEIDVRPTAPVTGKTDSTSETLTITGWVRGPGAGCPGSRLVAVFDGAQEVPVLLERLGLTSWVPARFRCGARERFWMSLSARVLGPGAHRVALVLVSDDGEVAHRAEEISFRID